MPTGPYRGAGRPEAACFIESIVDDAARKLGMDPVELRRINLIREFPYRTPVGFEYDSGDYERCMDRALELARPERADEPGRVVGTGVAVYVERAGGMFEAAEVSVAEDGRVLVRSSASPHGQGHATTFAQIVADRLGVEPEDVDLEFSDSATVPAGVGTFGSRSLTMAGSALVRALEDIDMQRRRIDPTRRRPLAELAADGAGLHAEARFESAFVFSSGAQAAVVEIERATGRLKVLRMGAVDDAGRIVNPLLAEGQVMGGLVQGLAECLTEVATWDEQGQQTSSSLADYSLLTAAEIPPVETAFVETPSPLNPLGAKGVGEGGAIGALAAVANAVADALGGRRVDPPYTAEKLWQRCGRAPMRLTSELTRGRAARAGLAGAAGARRPAAAWTWESLTSGPRGWTTPTRTSTPPASTRSAASRAGTGWRRPRSSPRLPEGDATRIAVETELKLSGARRAARPGGGPEPSRTGCSPRSGGRSWSARDRGDGSERGAGATGGPRAHRVRAARGVKGPTPWCLPARSPSGRCSLSPGSRSGSRSAALCGGAGEARSLRVRGALHARRGAAAARRRLAPARGRAEPDAAAQLQDRAAGRLVDLNRIEELAYLRRRDGALHIGALTRQAALERSRAGRRALAAAHPDDPATSAIPRSAPAGRSAARSRSPSPPPSCRSP